MNYSEEFMKAFDHLLPDLFASTMISDDKDKCRIRKLGELCRKHGVPFTKYMAVLQEYCKWEESL
jgi:hypothetical protein